MHSHPESILSQLDVCLTGTVGDKSFIKVGYRHRFECGNHQNARMKLYDTTTGHHEGTGLFCYGDCLVHGKGTHGEWPPALLTGTADGEIFPGFLALSNTRSSCRYARFPSGIRRAACSGRCGGVRKPRLQWVAA